MSNIACWPRLDQGCFTGYLRGEIQHPLREKRRSTDFFRENDTLYMTKTIPTFAPQLYIPNGVLDVDFYVRAFGAVELRRFSNEDGTVHVVEFSIDGALFHLHEVTQRERLFDPEKYNGTTV